MRTSTKLLNAFIYALIGLGIGFLIWEVLI